jgi:hypothetical protein
MQLFKFRPNASAGSAVKRTLGCEDYSASPAPHFERWPSLKVPLVGNPHHCEFRGPSYHICFTQGLRDFAGLQEWEIRPGHLG